MFQEPASWVTQKDFIPYEEALATMQARAQAIREGTARELVWLV